MKYTAVVRDCGDWWIGWIEEVPGVNCQERSLEELRASLASALAEALGEPERGEGDEAESRDPRG